MWRTERSTEGLPRRFIQGGLSFSLSSVCGWPELIPAWTLYFVRCLIVPT